MVNGIELGIKALQLFVTMNPEKHPPTDYSDIRQLYSEHYDKTIAMLDTTPKFGEGFQVGGSPVVKTVAPPIEIAAPAIPVTTSGKKEVATSCIACSRSHLATIAGALDEGLRFAREGGVTHPESIKRIDIAEREVTMLERIDLSPEAIQNSPPKEQELARGFLPKIRQLRQDIGQITSVEQMEKTASEASILTHEFRLRQMESAGADLNPIIALAKAVENGTMTIEAARLKVKEYLPTEA